MTEPPDYIPDLPLMGSRFLDFNFCEVLDPSLAPGGGPTQTDLIRMVYDARTGDRSASFEFAATMYWTLRRESFECFQKLHGPRPISYREWFDSKLQQLLEILVYESVSVDGLDSKGQPTTPKTDKPWEEDVTVLGPIGPPVDYWITQSFSPEDNDAGFWGQLIDRVCAAQGNRLAVLGAEAQTHRQGRSTGTQEPLGALPTHRAWHKNRNRNQIIDNLLRDGKTGEEICRVLDHRVIETIPALKTAGIHEWAKGWNQPLLRRSVEQLLSKRRKKLDSVKS